MIREQVLDTRCQDKDDEGEEEGREEGGESISAGVPPKRGPLSRLEYDEEKRGLREAFIDGGGGNGIRDDDNNNEE